MSVLRDPGTTQGQLLLGDWWVFLIAGGIIAGIVIMLILVAIVIWRRRPDGGFPPQFKKNTPLEISYTVVPLLIVAALFLVTYVYERRVEAQTAHPDAVVDVTAFRWSWRFDYPGTGVHVAGRPQEPPEFALPLDRTSRIVLNSADVVHAFWIPAFLFKRDAVPGMQNTFDLTPRRAGVFRGVCAEFCGLQHADMSFTVRVLPESDYKTWLASHKGSE